MGDPEDNQYFVEGSLHDVSPLDDGEICSNDEGNEYVAEGGLKSNNNLSSPVHVDIP